MTKDITPEADTPTELPEPKKSPKKFKLSSKLKGLLTNKLLDLFIVISGVTIAFQLSNIKQASEQDSLESFYLESFSADLNKDAQEINKNIDELKSDSHWAAHFLRQAKSYNKTMKLDSMDLAVSEILSFSTFNRNENTYATLTNGGGLSIISNKDIRNQITEYYKTYPAIDRFESVYTEFLINHFNRYFSPHYDYLQRQFVNPEIISNVQTRNNIALAMSQLSEGLSSYEESLEKGKALQESITKHLKK